MMGHLAEEAGRDRALSLEAIGEPVVVVGGGALSLPLVAAPGEVVGLAGLEGHGQREMLGRLYAAAGRAEAGARVRGSVAYVAGDRQTEGVFPLWSVAENTTVRALRQITRRGFIDLAAEKRLAHEWIGRIGVRSDGDDARITTLSGGNQQKVLFARALASEATIVILDDPMRGVDVGTKSEVYGLIRREAETGRCFVWYATETEELRHCDRVYVFKSGRIVAALKAGEIAEERILDASFTETMPGETP
jgi:ribose transport system ATP-binding protein